MRTWLGIVRIATLWTPVAILLFWGGSFLWACAEYLANPGVPLKLTYKAPAGELTLYADSYVVDLKDGDATIIRPRVIEPKGQTVFYADRIDAIGLPLLSKTNQRAVITARNVYATIVRRVDGKFDFLGYIPKREGPVSDFPYAVSVDRAKVKYVEVGMRTRHVQWVTVESLKVDGTGEKWLASADADIDGVGTLIASIQNLPGEGVWVRGTSPGLEVASLFEGFKDTAIAHKTPALEQISARSAKLQGPFEIFVPTTQAARFQSKLTANLVDFRYGKEYYAKDAQFQGTISADGAEGILDASAPGLNLKYIGRTNWQQAFRMDGNLDGTAASFESLPKGLKFNLPKYLAIRGPIQYSGGLTFDKTTGVGLEGDLSASSVTAYDESLNGPKTKFGFHDGNISAKLTSGIWRGVPLSGRLSVLKDRRLDGAFAVDNLNLTGLARRFKLDQLSGYGNVDLLLDGSLDAPIAYIQANSQAAFAVQPRTPATAGNLKLAATLRDGKLRIDQAYFVSNSGSISAQGVYNVDTRTLKVTSVASGIDLIRFDNRLNGIGRFTLAVSGPISQPHYQGTVDIFGLTVRNQSIPVIAADISGDLHRLVATNLKAVKGASQAEGNIALDLKSHAVSGNFLAMGVQLSDFLGDDYLASVNLTDARLSGTLENPSFNANASAKEILLKGTKLDSATAQITYRKDQLQVDNIAVLAGEGSLTGFLSYSLGKKQGAADFVAQQISIADFLPKDMGATIAAKFSGEAGITFSDQGFTQGSGEGKLASVVINDTPVGDGDWKLRSDGRIVSGDVFFGGLATSLDLTNLTYNLDSKEIGGNVWLRNLNVEDAYKISRSYLPDTNQQITTLLQQTKGVVGFTADLGGTTGNPNLQNASLSVANLAIGERKAGSIEAEFGRLNKNWNVGKFDWNGGPLNLHFAGTIDESGPIDVTGYANSVDISYLSLYDEQLGNWAGYVDVPLFALSGLTRSPEIHASVLSSSHMEPAEAIAGVEPRNKGIYFNAKSNDYFNFNLANVALVPTSQGYATLNIDGALNYHNYAANLEAQLPFEYPLGVPASQPLSASLTFQQDLKSILAPTDNAMAVGAQVFDPKTSEGKLAGKLELTGTKNQLALGGTLDLDAPTLAMQEGSTFKDVKVHGAFQDELIQMLVSANSAEGGSLSGQAQATLSPLEELVRKFQTDGFSTTSAAPLTGFLEATQFASKLKIGEDGAAGGVLDGKLAIGGQLGAPHISGELAISNGLVAMPSKLKESEAGLVPLVLPQLDVTVRTAGPAKFKSSSADMDIVGRGTIQGDFNNLDLDAMLRVQKGVLRLPTARVNIQQGGTMHPNLTIRDGVVESRLDVELEGKTNVVAARFGQTAQRYDVTLDVRGDLLQDGGLTLNATSDPPDLNTDEILALLGQVQLIEGLAGGLQSGNAQSHIREALLGIAVPYLLDPVTSQIASSLKLDYLTLDINALEGATISFAKTIGRNLVLSGSRQVTQVNHNYPVKYDLRLAYQFRFGPRGDRRRLNFIVGLDEVRPWKIAVEYGFRF